jgi:hypothetical protein
MHATIRSVIPQWLVDNLLNMRRRYGHLAYHKTFIENPKGFKGTYFDFLTDTFVSGQGASFDRTSFIQRCERAFACAANESDFKALLFS